MATMYRTHKIALDLTDRQKTHLSKSAGTARFAYNWALNEWNNMYEARKEDESLEQPNQLLLRRRLNSIKREQYPWMLEVTKCSPQEAIINLGNAFERFFDGLASYPVFKKKGVYDSFRVSSGHFDVIGKTIRLPHIGILRMREGLRYENARPVRVTISRRADRWFAAITCEIEKPPCRKNAGKGVTVGIDAGVNAYVASDTRVYETPRSYRKAERNLRRRQQSLSRKQKGSNNYEKQKMKVAKCHAKSSDVRNNFLHYLTNDIVATADIIVIEDLNVKGMLRNRRLSKSISDASFGEFRRQLTYKAEAAGKTLIIADRFYPSSKLCSVCGAKTKHLTLGMREWVCEECGSLHDREINASKNLEIYADSSSVSVRGELFASAIPQVNESMVSYPYEAETKRQIAS